MGTVGRTGMPALLQAWQVLAFAASQPRMKIRPSAHLKPGNTAPPVKTSARQIKQPLRQQHGWQ
jgi:hypothetical protein